MWGPREALPGTGWLGRAEEPAESAVGFVGGLPRMSPRCPPSAERTSRDVSRGNQERAEPEPCCLSLQVVSLRSIVPESLYRFAKLRPFDVHCPSQAMFATALCLLGSAL